MTPAINLVIKKKISHKIHEYKHDTNYSAYGLEAAEKLKVEASRVFKTLAAKVDQNLVIGIVPVNRKLDLKGLAKAVKSKKAVMAEPQEVEKSTGYVLGGVSPLAQKKRLATVLDQSAMGFPSIFVSAGRRGVELELSPGDLIELIKAQVADISVVK